VHPDREELAADLDAWLMARESDGTLAGLRRRYLGHGDSPPTAEPLSALLATVGERLDLMPLVAEAKRAAGAPVDAPGQEARVVATALEAARETRLTAVSERSLRRFFELQIAAAKEIQRATLAGPAGTAPPADLETALRPPCCGSRRIALLAQRLPARIDRRDLEARARERLRTPGLSEGARGGLVEAILALPEARHDQP
jgi:cyclohexadienyl dehydratase